MNAKRNVRQKAKTPMLVAVIVAALAMSACGSGQPGLPLDVGATGRTSGVDVTLRDTFDPWAPGIPGLSPREGTRWVGVNVSVTNVTGEGRRWDSAVTMRLTDLDGHEFGMVWFGDPGLVWLRVVDLRPGGSASGLVLFEVPVGVDRLRLTEIGRAHV